MRRALVALALLLTGCRGDGAPEPAAPPTTAAQRPVRVGVWAAPDPTHQTFGAAAVRTLVYPQLFRATPSRGFEPSLVEPGSHRTRPGARSAAFRLRAGAVWSDGTPITVEDLRRTMDPRFVAAVEDPTPAGTIVVRFTQPLPGWRRLWSGTDAIAPPAESVFGGPYRVERVTPGLETVLVANDTYAGPRPHIRELRLVLVPDPETQVRLLERGELDVIAPLAFTERRARLARLNGVGVRTTSRGGWTVSLVANPARLAPAQRHALLALANAPRFTDVILHREATATGERVMPGGDAFTERPAVVAPLESAAATLFLHGMQRAGHRTGRGFDVRQSEFDRVLAAYAAGDYDALVSFVPVAAQVCWTCAYAGVDAALARDADAGVAGAGTALRRTLAEQFLELPLWRERPVVAVRDGLAGVSANGFHVAGPLWDVESWRWLH